MIHKGKLAFPPQNQQLGRFRGRSEFPVRDYPVGLALYTSDRGSPLDGTLTGVDMNELEGF